MNSARHTTDGSGRSPTTVVGHSTAAGTQCTLGRQNSAGHCRRSAVNHRPWVAHRRCKTGAGTPAHSHSHTPRGRLGPNPRSPGACSGMVPGNTIHSSLVASGCVQHFIAATLFPSSAAMPLTHTCSCGAEISNERNLCSYATPPLTGGGGEAGFSFRMFWTSSIPTCLHADVAQVERSNYPAHRQCATSTRPAQSQHTDGHNTSTTQAQHRHTNGTITQHNHQCTMSHRFPTTWAVFRSPELLVSPQTILW